MDNRRPLHNDAAVVVHPHAALVVSKHDVARLRRQGSVANALGHQAPMPQRLGEVAVLLGMAEPVARLGMPALEDQPAVAEDAQDERGAVAPRQLDHGPWMVRCTDPAEGFSNDLFAVDHAAVSGCGTNGKPKYSKPVAASCR